MATIINLATVPHVWNKGTQTFTMSEKHVPFATTYLVKNPATGGEMEFDFAHSTGPEFDPTTKWVYKSKAGLFLEVCNDAQMTKIAAAHYLAHKTR